jgi:hypothetical protein
MGFLDRAKKLAEQAKDKAEQARDMAQQAIADAQARQAAPAGSSSGGTATGGPSGSGSSGPVEFGTPYVPGMLGRPGWRERGLEDPAAVLPIKERDRAGVPHSVKSQILEEPYGMGRRWSAGPKSAALFYQLYPEHQSWQPPGGTTPFPSVAGAAAADLPDGRSLVFIGGGERRVVLELAGLDESARSTLAQSVASQLAADN